MKIIQPRTEGKLIIFSGHYQWQVNFVPHTQVFDGYDCQIIPSAEEKGSPSLVVKNKKNKKKQLTIAPFSNIVKAGKKGQEEIRLQSVVVYVDKNNTFYVPKQLADFLK